MQRYGPLLYRWSDVDFVCVLSVCVGHTGQPCKTDKPIEMSFGGGVEARLACAEKTTYIHVYT